MASLSHYLRHLESFMKTNLLFGDEVGIALSGGLDSMALLQFLYLLRQKGALKKITAIHINHGTRGEENKKEEEIITKACYQLSIPLSLFSLQLDLCSANFEEEARKARYQILLSESKKYSWLYTAHHIDDSYEWWLMQRGRSSEIKSSLGIPLVNGKLARPLMAFTREQLEILVKKEKWPWSQDSSNHNTQYLRNYVRHRIIPSIKKKFPQYLKHYSRQSEQLAYRLGVSRYQEISGVKEWSEHLLLLAPGVYSLKHPRGKNLFYGSEEVLKNAIYSLSLKSRGQLSNEIHKLIEAASSYKKGPMSFSGGVKAYIRRGEIILTAQSSEYLARQILDI